MSQPAAVAGVEMCYLCHAALPPTGFTVDGICFKICRSCGLIVRSPLPTQEELTALYTPEYYADEETYAQYEDPEASEVLPEMLQDRLAHLNRLAPRNGSVLDVGCGLGDFLAVARDNGWSIRGIEASPHAAHTAREKLGDCVDVGTLDSISLAPSSYTAVMFWDVVEHLVDPRRILQRTWDVLEPGGVVAISMPNAAGVKARMLGHRWRYFQRKFGHVMHYAPDTLRRLTEQAGFRVESVETQGFFNLSFFESRLPEPARSKLPHINLDRGQRLADAAAGKLNIGENMVLYGRRALNSRGN